MNKVIYTAAIILIAISLNAQIELINSKIGIGTSTPSADVHLRGNNGTTEFKLETNKFSLMGGNVGIGTAAPQARLDISNGTLRLSDYGNNAVSGSATSILGVEADGDVVEIDLSELTTGETSTTGAIASENPGISTILFPEGAFYSGWANATGAIEINLPQLWTATMMSLEIEVYDYTRQESFTVKCGGYNFAGGYWVNTFARVEGSPVVDRNFNVRFGHDSDNVKIWIGELTSVWQFPMITVTNVQLGLFNTEVDKWDDGWSIDIVQSFDDVVQYNQTNTQANNLIRNGTSAYYNTGKVGIGTANPFRSLDINSGQLQLNTNVTLDKNQGIFFWTGDPYSIRRTSGPWSAPNYQQLEIDFPTGIVLNPGTAYGKSMVGVTSSMSIGRTFHAIKPPTNSLIVEKYVGIGTKTPTAALDVVGDLKINGIIKQTGNHVGFGSALQLHNNVGGYNWNIGEVLEDTKLDFRAVGAPGNPYILRLNGATGQWTGQKYGKGHLSGTEIYLLGVEADGDIVEVELDKYKTINENFNKLLGELETQESKVSQLESMVADLLGKLENLVSDDYDTYDHIVDLSHEDVQFAGLGQNRPNPTANDAVIDYLLPDAFNDANIRFYTVSGEVIREIELTEPGIGKLLVDTIDLPNGSFMYSLIVDGDLIDTKTMIIQK